MNLNGFNWNTPTTKITGALLFLGLVLTLALKFKFIFQESLWPDEALYLYIGRNLTRDITDLTNINGNFFYQNPPLLMYLLSMVKKIGFLEFQLAARVLIALMGTGTVVTTYFIAKKIYTPLIGLIAAFLLAACPLSNWIGVRILTDIPVVFWIYLALCMLVYDRKTSFYIFALMAVLTKYTSFPVLLLPFFLKLKPKTWLTLYIVGFGLLFIFGATKNWYPVPHGWLGYGYGFFSLPNLSEMITETRFFMGYVLFVLFFIGLFYTIREERFTALFHWIILFGICRIFLPWVAFRVSRYTLPFYPGFYVFAAYGGYRIVKAAQVKWLAHSRWISFAALSAVVILIFAHSSRSLEVLDGTSRTFIGFQKAGAFLMARSGPHSLATASPRQMQYFAPSYTVYNIPSKMTPEKLSNFIKAKNIQYVSIDFWSPHLPSWCRSYNFQNNGYHLIFGQNYVFIFNTANVTSKRKSM